MYISYVNTTQAAVSLHFHPSCYANSPDCSFT